MKFDEFDHPKTWLVGFGVFNLVVAFSPFGLIDLPLNPQIRLNMVKPKQQATAKHNV